MCLFYIHHLFRKYLYFFIKLSSDKMMKLIKMRVNIQWYYYIQVYPGIFYILYSIFYIIFFLNLYSLLHCFHSPTYISHLISSHTILLLAHFLSYHLQHLTIISLPSYFTSSSPPSSPSPSI